MHRVRVMIVDDEAHCRFNLRESIEQHTQWEIVAELPNANTLSDEVKRKHVDLVFLDISMPGISGMGAAKNLLTLETPPMIVFVTAFDNFAIEAFEICAIDYLLKPFDTERFINCAERIDGQVQTKTRLSRGLKILSGGEYLQQIAIKSMTSISVIKTKDIAYLASSGNYVEIYHCTGQALLRSSLSSVLHYLDPLEFCQVHRKIVVKLALAKDLQTTPDNKHQLVLTNGKIVPVGEKFRANFLNRWLKGTP